MYNTGQYQEALIYLSRIDKLESSGPLLFKKAVCLYETNQLDQAFMDFRKAYEYGYKDEHIDYYIGRIKHHKGEFREAAEYYKSYLRSANQTAARRAEATHLIRQCGYAIELSYLKPIAIINNPGQAINSRYDDFGWIQSPNDPDQYYFTTNRPNTVISMAAGHHEIYQIADESGTWSKTKRLTYPVNSRAEEILSGISQSGDALLIYRKDEKSAKHIIHRRGSQKGKQKSIDIASRFEVENGMIQFYSDDIAIYAADQPDGYGGYDLYISYREGSGWTTPINMGPEINSPYDELSPYISNEGRILYFSSNRIESVGGYDIFRSTYLFESAKWSAPSNLGIPINSPGDDLYFHLNDDGLTAHFSSDRKNGVGGLDIYFAQFKSKEEGQEFYAGLLPFLSYSMDEVVAIAEEAPTTPSPAEDPIADDLSVDDITADSVALSDIAAEQIDGPELDSAEPVILRPLFFDNSRDILSEENMSQIAAIATALSSYPESVVELISHTADDGIPEYNLYASLKVAEKVKNTLTKNGIDAARIRITGLGASYPLVKSQMESMAQAYNSRIDIKIHNNENIVVDNEIDVDPIYTDLSYELYRTLIDQTISYKIEIATVNQMYRGIALSLFNDAAIEVLDETGLYAYTIGLYDNYAEAINTQRSLEREGVVDAKVIPYIDGKRLKADDITYYINEYPDLKNFMNYDRTIGSN